MPRRTKFAQQVVDAVRDEVRVEVPRAILRALFGGNKPPRGVVLKRRGPRQMVVAPEWRRRRRYGTTAEG
jgi:hypothetical protein